MFAASNVSVREKLLLAAGASLLAVLCACATASAPQPSPAPESAVISELRVENEGAATIVSLLGLVEPVYTAFQQDDPARVVVDLSQAKPGEIAEEVAIYDGTVEEISVTPFVDEGGQERTRVELSLATAASYEIVALEERLEIRVVPESEFDVAIEDPWAGAATELAIEASEIEMPENEVDGSQVDTGPQATALLDLSAETEGAGVVIDLQADGRIDNASQFVIQDPLRLVVDLPALVSKAGNAELTVESGKVARVRVGQHPDKVRVVVDGGQDPNGFEAVQLVPMSTGLMLVIGSEEIAMPAAAVSTAPAPDTEAAEKTGTLQVYGVQFDAQESGDRVVILSDAMLDYQLAQPDPDTVVVRIQGATIDPEAAVRIAPEQPGPVSLVTAFAQPEADEPEVRVVISRAAGLEPQVEQQGTMLFLDFPRGSDIAGELPMMEDLGSMVASQGEPGHGNAAPSKASAKALGQTEAELMVDVPAAIDGSGGSVEILKEGGLVDGKQYTGRRISLDFKDVEIDDVLRLIAEVSDLNIIAGDEVSGQVTIRLVDVPWDQALDVILLTKGLGFIRVGSVLRIAPSEQLAAEEEARLQERRAKEKLEDLVVKLQPVNYADVKEMAKMIKRLLTSRGTVDIDARTNTVILKDIPSVITEATALIKAIDTQTPQVLIEAKIVEANLDFSRELGSVWGFGFQSAEDASNPTAGALGMINPITSLPTSLLDVSSLLLDERFNIDLQIQAAESSGEGKVISSPRVVTLDNREATIEQGVSIPFQTFENGDAKLEFIDAVLSLQVTPHITADRSIIMKIEVKRNAPDDSVQTPTGSPAIAKNEAETETLVKDGQTLVIGGIYTIESAERESRVPYLHKIPLLGYAFKNNEVRDIRKELLVFVTPRIVVNPEVGA